MIKFDSLSLNRFHFFENAKFDFRPGISMVTGDNGSGKSLLFSAIPTMLSLLYDNKSDWEKPPKGSKLDFSFHSNDIPIDFNITTAASSKFNLSFNNQDQHPHTRKDAQNALLKHWKIPQALFQSTVFLRGIDRHPLSQGTPGTRAQWLAQALDLAAIYDAYKLAIDEKLSSLSSAISKQAILEEELSHAKAQIPESDISKEAAQKAERILKKHRDILRDNPNRINEIDNALKAIEQIVHLPEISRSLDDIQEELDEVRVKRAKLSKQAQRFEELLEIKQANAEISSEIKQLKKRGFDKSQNINLLKETFEKQERIVERYVRDKQAYEEQADDILLWDGIKTMKPQTRNLEEAEELLSALVYRGTQQQDTVENLQGLDANAKICPTCGNKLTRNHITHEIIRLERELKILPQEIKRIKLEIRYWKLKKRKFPEMPQKPKFSSKEHSALDKQIQLHEQYAKLKAQLQPEEELPDNVEERLEKLDSTIKRLDKLRYHAIQLKSYQRLLPEEYKKYSRQQLIDIQEVLLDELKRLKYERQTSSDMVDKYSRILMKFDTQTKLQKQYRSTIKRLNEEIDNLRTEAKDLDAWKALSVAYGNSGVRLYHLRESAAVLSKELTELSALFFNTTYYFNIEVGSHKLDVHVERKGKVGSVKTLSGAESRSWNLLSAMALIRVLPNAMRCDTIILDEIEANMNKKSRDRYTRDVLPELQSIIPKVVLISPLADGEMNVQADRRFVVQNTRIDGQHVSKLHSI